MLTVPRSGGAHGGSARAAGAGGARPLSDPAHIFPREVETERLRLRQFREDDFDAYLRILADPEVRRHLGAGDARSREEMWRLMAMHAGIWTIRGFGLWAVELKSTGELIGRAGVWFPEGWPEIEAGWVIAPEHWGFGYATEAAREALRQAFATLGVTHVMSLIRPDNLASRRVAEKLGGTVDKTEDFHGLDVLFYGYGAPPE